MTELRTYDEKLLHYAGAKRITTEQISNYKDGNFVHFWAGKLKGVIVSTEIGYKFNTKEEAKANAEVFRQQCINEAIKKGLM